MATRFPRFRSAWPALVLLAAPGAGCATRSYRVQFREAAINAKPIALILDTGSNASYITETAAERLALATRPVRNMKMNGSGRLGLSAPLLLAVGGNTTDLPFLVTPMPKEATRGLFDAAMGWPEVRHNILEFDPVQRVVRRLDSLPPEVATWIRLKVLARPQLWVEIPLENGATLPVMLDTGSPVGVALPDENWRKWVSQSGLAVHASRTLRMGHAPIATERIADVPEIRLGPLSFNHMMVEPHLDMSGKRAVAVGTLGILALAQMNLIVDADGGYAYVRPRLEAAAGRPRSFSATLGAAVNWTVDPGVQFRTDGIQALAAWVAGDAKMDKADYVGAIEDYSRSLALEPDAAVVSFERGQARYKVGDYAGAAADLERSGGLDPELWSNVELSVALVMSRLSLEDFDGALSDIGRALELRPEIAVFYMLRGTARAAKRDFSGAEGDLRRTQELDPKHPEIYQELRDLLEKLRAGTRARTEGKVPESGR